MRTILWLMRTGCCWLEAPHWTVGRASQWASALDTGRKTLQTLVGMVNPDMALEFKGLSPFLQQEPHLLYLYYMWGFRAQGTEGGSGAFHWEEEGARKEVLE